MKKILVIMAAVALVAAAALPAFAAPSVTIGARINQSFGWRGFSDEQTKSGDGYADNFTSLISNSWFQANYVSEDKKTGAKVEMSLSSSNVGLRHAYGWYKIGNCTLLAGQTDNFAGDTFWPLHKMSEIDSGDGLGWGKMWAPRRPQISLTWKSGNYAVQFAVEEVSSYSFASGSTVDYYNTVPRMTLGFSLKAGAFAMMPAINWQQLEANGVASGKDDSVQAWAFILPVRLTFGAFMIEGEFHYSLNPGIGFSGYSGATPVLKADGKFEDTTNYGGYLQLSYKIGALTVAGGIGYEYFTNDAWKDAGAKDDNQDRMLYWLAFPYKVHKYLTLYPEIVYLDYKEDVNDNDLGNAWSVGVLMRFVF